MAASGKTPIQFYRSTTSGNTPSASNLSPGELALNIADNDMTMYFENASGTVKRFFNNPAALKYPTADGTSGQVISTNAAGVLSFANAGSSAVTDNTRQAVTSSATTTINLASGQVIDLTMAANITSLSFTNVPASGTPILVQIVVKNASDGTAYTIAWPSSVYWSGQYTGTTITNAQTAPTLATGANGVTTIALLTTDGGTKWRGWVEGTIPGGTQNSLYSWGINSAGQLGLNSTGYRSSPVQVGALTNWAAMANGDTFALAIKNDGTLWSWGANAVGQLGQNAATYLSSPVQIGVSTDWSFIAARLNSSAAIKTNGTLWTWGRNQYGQLGQNNRTNISSPVQVGASTWAKAAFNFTSAFAINTSGALFSWGRGDVGQLGQNDRTDRSSPVQVGALTNWATIVANSTTEAAAITTAGALFTWGNNYEGALGLNDRVYRSSPVQVGALTDWASGSGGDNFFVFVKTNGTLWSWGKGSNGRLGQNSTAYRSSPVQVGALTDWSSSAAGRDFGFAVKTNGTLWSWGRNQYGQLGLNTRIDNQSPAQIGALTTWTNVFSGALGSANAFIGTPVNPG